MILDKIFNNDYQPDIFMLEMRKKNEMNSKHIEQILLELQELKENSGINKVRKEMIKPGLVESDDPDLIRIIKEEFLATPNNPKDLNAKITS